ncbi:MAG: iron-containing alcohol dehydrogenase [Spirochaetaceae bacterium]
MDSLKVQFPETILFGSETLQKLGSTVRQYGDRVLLVSESVLHEGNHIGNAQDLMVREGIDVLLFDELMPGSTAAAVDEVLSLARASKAKAIVGMGGMRVLSIAKTAAAIASGKHSVNELLNGGVRFEAPLPYVEVPSSYRNHFMLRDAVILKDGVSKDFRILKVPNSTTKAVVVDTNLTHTLSQKYAVSAMMDTLLAAVEGYLSNAANVLSDTVLIRAVRLLKEAILGSVRSPTDMRYRRRASEAGLLTAMGLSQSEQGVGGAISYAVNSRFEVPKSWVATVLLPHVLETHVSHRAEKLSDISAALGETVDGIMPEEDAQRSVRAVRRMLGMIELPSRLRDLDLSMDDLAELSGIVADTDMARKAALSFSTERIAQLLKTAF